MRVGAWRVVGLFLSLIEPYIPDLSTLLSLEPLEKVPGGDGGGGWWWCLNPILVFSLSLSQAEQKTTKSIGIYSSNGTGFSGTIFFANMLFVPTTFYQEKNNFWPRPP